ncbi:MAG TPA: nucleotidyl transferase AbiEii/AbiGii toxin family protein [Bryobacteraceae bacterium]
MRELSAVAGRVEVPFFLAGASARDIVLVNLWGQRPGRATADIDFAFALADWAEFDRLRQELLATKRFERVRRKEQRLMYIDAQHRFQLPVDFIPFGGVASDGRTIAWPPEGDFVMNVAGFEEAFEAALRIQFAQDLVVSVASLPGLAILKLLAWSDRRLVNTKDAADLYRILSSFDRAGNEDRIFGDEIDLLEAADYDPTFAGARLLGRDVFRIAHQVTTRQIVTILNSDRLQDLLVSHMVATASYEENAGRVAAILASFRTGFLDRAR